MKFMGYFAPRRRSSRRINHRRNNRNSYHRQLQVEALEDRRVLSVTVITAQLFDSLDGLLGTDADGVHNGTLTISGDLTIKDGGSINANDNWAGSVPNSDAQPPIVINVSGNVLIETDTAGAIDTGIFAENRNQGGFGGDITLTVGGTFVMQNGATISSSDATIGGNPAGSGDISIDVVGSIDIQTGATIKAGVLTSSNGPGGAIVIESEDDINMDGSVLSQSGLSGTGASQRPGGGTITINAKDELIISDTGIVSSKGQDPGADLVHLEGCHVIIYGLVESTGVGHALPNNPPNHLNDHANHPANSTAGVEVWADELLLIDSTGGHNGQVSADLSSGEDNRSWIDLFATGDIQIIGQPIATGTFFSVRATNAGNGAVGGQITIASTEGTVTAGGLAVNAGAQGIGLVNAPEGNAAGGDGGKIIIEALNNIVLDTAKVAARGDNVPTIGIGGTIAVRSANGTLSWQNGVGDVRPTGQDLVGPDTGVPLANRGVITLQAAGAVTTTGTSFPFTQPNANTAPTTPTIAANTPSAAPVLPDYVVLPVCDDEEFDFGDAPENPIVPGDYPTTLANDGARHVIVDGFHLGATIDAETDGQPNGTATGDDDNPANTDDEDGVIFNGPFVPGLSTSITVTLTGATGLLDAWFDWNGDGDWLDTLEQVFTNQPLVAGANALSVSVPLFAVVDVNGAPTFTRFRLSSAGNLQSTGEAADGEVEDYKIHIDPYWTSKCAVITQIGECFAIPDVLVDVDSGPAVFDVTRVGTLLPATKSIQAAIAYVNANGDVNGDGKLLVAVTAKDTLVQSAACGGIPFVGRDLGGDGFENFVVTNPSGQQLYVMGNSVNIHAVNKNLPVATIKSSVGKVTYMDIHGLDSNVAGIKVGGATAVEKNAGAVLVKNTSAQNNVGGIGIWVYDDKVEVSGSQHLNGNKVGIQIDGNDNTLRTNNEIMKNSGLGIKVAGNNNLLTDQDVGKSGNGNGGGGIEVAGNNNTIQDSEIAYNTGNGVKITGTGNTVDGNEIYNNTLDAIWASGNSNKFLGNDLLANGGDGLEASGNSNVIQKNLVGDKSKGNKGDGIRVTGDLNQILENEIFANLGRGIDVIGTGTNGNVIKKNTVGDKSKGGNGSDGIRVSGKNNTLEANTVNANKGYGVYITGAASTGNKLKDNKSNTENSGSGSENLLAEFKFEAAITNQGGNKKDNANFTAITVGTYE